jgi:hypothetical protein
MSTATPFQQSAFPSAVTILQRVCVLAPGLSEMRLTFL